MHRRPVSRHRPDGAGSLTTPDGGAQRPPRSGGRGSLPPKSLEARRLSTSQLSYLRLFIERCARQLARLVSCGRPPCPPRPASLMHSRLDLAVERCQPPERLSSPADRPDVTNPCLFVTGASPKCYIVIWPPKLGAVVFITENLQSFLLAFHSDRLLALSPSTRRFSSDHSRIALSPRPTGLWPRLRRACAAAAEPVLQYRERVTENCCILWDIFLRRY